MKQFCCKMVGLLILVTLAATGVSQELTVTLLPGADPLIPHRPDQASDALIPAALDFGEVEVGTATGRVFRIASPDRTPLQVFGISLSDNPHSAFDIAGYSHNGTRYPGAIPPFIFSEILEQPFVPTFLDVEVTFAPAMPVVRTGTLVIHSNDHAFEYIDLPLEGTGIADQTSVPEPFSAIVWSLLAAVGAIGFWRCGHSRR